MGYRDMKEDLSVQVWIFLSIPSKNIFSAIAPHPNILPLPMVVIVGKHDVSFHIWAFHAIPRKKYLLNSGSLPIPTPMGWAVVEHDISL